MASAVGVRGEKISLGLFLYCCCSQSKGERAPTNSQADDDKLGLYLDTEEWPTAIMSELPLEGTAVDSDAFGT